MAQFLGQPCEFYPRSRQVAQRLNTSPIWCSQPRARQPRERPTAWRSPPRLPMQRHRRPPRLPSHSANCIIRPTLLGHYAPVVAKMGVMHVTYGDFRYKKKRTSPLLSSQPRGRGPRPKATINPSRKMSASQRHQLLLLPLAAAWLCPAQAPLPPHSAYPHHAPHAPLCPLIAEATGHSAPVDEAARPEPAGPLCALG